MKRTTLSPRDAAWLNETFARNSARFAGWKMMADPDPKTDPVVDPKTDPKSDGAGSPAAVLADLAKERKARQALEAQVAELAPLKDQMVALAAVFGVKADPKAEDGQVLADIKAQVASLQRDNAVLALANAHGITDAADLNMLKASALEGEALDGLAQRLKPTAVDPKSTPKPDLSQGPKGDPVKPDSLPGVPRMAQAFDDAMTTN